MKKELVEARNAADGLIYTVEKSLAEHADKVDPNTRAEVEKAAGDLKREMEGDNVAEIKRLTETLTHASQAMAQAMYQQAGPTAAGQQTAGEAGHANRSARSTYSEEVVDAEYEEVK
jgi:molecular chaperone DnaK